MVGLSCLVLISRAVLRAGYLRGIVVSQLCYKKGGTHGGVSDVIRVGCWDMNNAHISSKVFPVAWLVHTNQAQDSNPVQQVTASNKGILLLFIWAIVLSTVSLQDCSSLWWDSTHARTCFAPPQPFCLVFESHTSPGLWVFSVLFFWCFDSV